MKPQRQQQSIFRGHQYGVAAVEFALVSSVFFIFLFGIMEMGRMLFYWNSAVEATRFGARIAVVCDLNDTAIKARMQERLAILTADKISINYEPTGCSVNTCQAASVSILPGVTVATYIPFVPLSFTLPTFSTALPRESMRSTLEGIGNPMCD